MFNQIKEFALKNRNTPDEITAVKQAIANKTVTVTSCDDCECRQCIFMDKFGSEMYVNPITCCWVPKSAPVDEFSLELSEVLK